MYAGICATQWKISLSSCLFFNSLNGKIKKKKLICFVSSALAYFSLKVPAHLWKVLCQPVQLHIDGYAKWGSRLFSKDL